MTDASYWDGTGMHIPIEGRVNQVPDLVEGRHSWVVMNTYRIGDPSSQIGYLDAENLLSITGPFCFWCEETHTEELAAQPCPGDASA